MSKISNIEALSTKNFILIKGARLHNLKNIDVAIPRNKFVVITGVSGSGKSTLAFDTLYAEGQRRYVESLSSYARQFLGKLNKPDVDYIKGISPAVAIEQKVISRNPRSTVGTSTEVYDYLKLLFARIGKTYSPVSGNEVKRHTVTDVCDHINAFPDGTKVLLLSPLKGGKSIKEQLTLLSKQGFSRIKAGELVVRIDEFLKKPELKKVEVVIDRIVVNKKDEDNNNRISDSVQTAFYEGQGDCVVEAEDKKPVRTEFSNRFELDGLTFEEPSVHFFSFNNPVGACKNCGGFGNIIGIDEDLVIPNKSLSVYEGAVACWKGEKMEEWKEEVVMSGAKADFPIHKPYYELNTKQKKMLWEGSKHFHGINDFFQFVERESYKIQYRVMLSRYRGKTTCPDCNGTRLRKDVQYVKVDGKNISKLVLMQIKDLRPFFESIKLSEHEKKVAKRILIEIQNRLRFLDEVGLGYLTLNRLSSSLSGGESQRINLATSLGSSLVGSMYILDEPSIGLHPRDTQRLIGVLQSLKKIGNTVIVVEHDEEIMRAADELIDIGPMAGNLGGNLVFHGNHTDILSEQDSLTAKYLSGKEKITIPSKRRRAKSYIGVSGARENNLKNLNVKIPLNVLCVVTGVSGSGKTSLVKKILYPALRKQFGGYGEQTGKFDRLTGDLSLISAVEFVDQNPIGKSSRSNPVTYVKAYDEIRTLMAEQPLARLRGYKPSHFSFNVDGGRCEVCEGEGEVTIEMQFMADVHLPCEACNGKRFKEDVLETQFAGKNVSDILDMTVDQAIGFFTSTRPDEDFEGLCKRIVARLKPLQDVGLGYVHLGQSSSTLSGGEAQRVKLASFIGMGQAQLSPTLFIFDEPTTGLHFHDIRKLLDAFSRLTDMGHSIVIIEHNQEIIKCADWVIDLGPEGGDEGGQVVFEGTPEDLVKCKESHTGKFLKEKL